MFVLAMSDSLTLAMWVINLAISAGITIVLARVASWQRRFDRQEDTHKADTRSLREEMDEQARTLHQVTEKLIDERFRKVTHQVENHALLVSGTLAELKEQIKESKGELDDLGERDQKIEGAVAAKFDVLKDWIRDTTATSAELDKHERNVNERLGGVERRMTEGLSELGKNVAVLAERVGPGKRGNA
jgi:DNA-directed RNA polymerase sigma subunit (sigma70/sigma32)